MSTVSARCVQLCVVSYLICFYQRFFKKIGIAICLLHWSFDTPTHIFIYTATHTYTHVCIYIYRKSEKYCVYSLKNYVSFGRWSFVYFFFSSMTFKIFASLKLYRLWLSYFSITEFVSKIVFCIIFTLCFLSDFCFVFATHLDCVVLFQHNKNSNIVRFLAIS